MMTTNFTEFPDDYDNGHFAIIGKTGSGKTYYTKYLIRNLISRGAKPIIFVGGISRHDWVESGEIPEEDIYSEWNDEIINEMTNKLISSGRGIVVFDDFKGEVNFHGDSVFAEMFRTFRHINTQVLAIGHTPGDIPPVIKNNITHLIMTYTNNRTTIKNLADNYLGGDHNRLIQVLRNLPRYSVIKINCNNNRLDIHKAPENPMIGGHTGQFSANPSSEIGMGNNAFTNRHVSVSGGQYYDASHNNQFLQLEQNINARIVNNQLSYQDMRERSELSMQLDMDRVIHEQKKSEYREIQECRELLYQFHLSLDDKCRLSQLLAKHLRDSRITPYNYVSVGADLKFMEYFFPNENYSPRTGNSGLVRDHGHIVVDYFTGNYSNVFQSFAGLFAGNTQKQKRITSSEINKRRRREKIRDLILNLRAYGKEGLDELLSILNTVWSDGEVTLDNVNTVINKFMENYYPEDLRRIRKERSERRRIKKLRDDNRDSGQIANVPINESGTIVNT